MFLPVNKRDLEKRGWKKLDIIIITGDAYVDHSSFGAAIISRYLESFGYKVGIIAQPQNEADYRKLGEPKLFWGITSGNLDSMISNYTAAKKVRNDNKYAENGKAFLKSNKKKRIKPDRALVKYAQKVKEFFDNPFIVLGGVEASLRRFSHYDFYQDKLRHSVIVDSKADLIVYGMGERAILEIADKLAAKKETKNIKGTLEIIHKDKFSESGIELPNIKEMNKDRTKIIARFNFLQENTRPKWNKILLERDGAWILKQNPPQELLSTKELDAIYSLPFERKPHPSYKNIPAFEMIKHSITAHRGCFGGCAFCSIGLHQGKMIQSRSKESIKNEIKKIKKEKNFKGHITDIGGPSADMYSSFCSKFPESGCSRLSCLYPKKCKFLKLNIDEYLSLLKDSKKLVNKISIGSGLRLDISMCNKRFLKTIVDNYLSGYLNIAPEHISKKTLKYMKKFKTGQFQYFVDLLKKIKFKNNYLLRPYFIVGHPGDSIQESNNLVNFLKKNKMSIESIQEFVPVPLTLSTAYYFARKDLKGKKISILSPNEKKKLKKKLLTKRKY